MKWDIDKALSLLEIPGTAGTCIDRVLVGLRDTGTIERLGLTSRKTSEGHAMVWALGLGKLANRKVWFYGWTIREAYLKAKKAVKKMSTEDLCWYGIQPPRSKKNSFISARKRK